MKRLRLFFCTIIIALVLSSCSAQHNTSSFFAMDTAFSLDLTGGNSANAAKEIKQEILKLDDLFSVTKPGSDISLINSSDTVQAVSEQTAEIVSRAKEISEITDGCFDITIYPVTELWGFTKQQYSVPDSEDIRQALLQTGAQNIEVKDNTVFHSGKLDIGGIAKGYACDIARDMLTKHGVKKGIVSSGSSILLYGGKFTVGIQHPLKSDELICTLSAEDTCIVTSGGYQRNFEQDGKIYHHIIDPKTGRPADSGIISATVISRDGTLADGLSTALYVMGVDKAIELYRSQDGFEMILVTDSKIYSTVDIKPSDNDYELQIINKEL